jgi:hypothetical protein
MTNKYIGVARLRQHRVLPELCKVPEIMRFLNVSCWSDFSLSHAETKTFGYAWGEVTSHMALDRLKSIWRYTSPLKTETLGTFGNIKPQTLQLLHPVVQENCQPTPAAATSSTWVALSTTRTRTSAKS